MKGYLMLTEGRSGSNWLGSLANNTGEMGVLEEWVDTDFLGTPLTSLSAETFLDRVFSKASTANGRFAVKLFPRHLYMAHHLFDLDFIAEARKRHEVSLIFLHRSDRLRQAISFAKGRVTGQWRSTQPARGEARYDFEEICRCYFFIERSYAYWRSYLGLLGAPYDEFEYEILAPDPSSYLSRLAQLLEVDTPSDPRTELRVQRDDQTEEWLSRFREDMMDRNIVGASSLHRPSGRNITNLRRFLRKEPMIPLPMHF